MTTERVAPAPPPPQSVRAATPLGPLLARGWTAEIYAYGAGRVVKLLLAGRPRHDAEREAAIGRLVQEAYAATNRAPNAGTEEASQRIPAPAIHDVVEIDGRFGVVFERIDGPSMLDVLMARPWLVSRLAPLLGELHARVHRAAISPTAAATLRSLPAELRRKIGRVTDLSDAGRAAALERLASLEQRLHPATNLARDADDRRLCLCHGDFHPANVILSRRGPVIVDWNDATLGPPAADVARTKVLLLHGELPASIFPAKRFVIQALRRVLYALYLRRYRSLTGVSTSEIDAWHVPTITARRSERPPPA